MPQYFIDKTYAPGESVEIKGPDAHHILNVLRLKTGDWIVLSDGCGKSFKTVIMSTTSKSVEVSIESIIERNKTAPPPVLALALIKKDRFEWCVEKTVELGCRRIIPFISTRCIIKLKGDNSRKLKRWNDIALQAAKQSGLPFVPKVEHPLSFGALCELSDEFDEKILFFEGEDAKTVKGYWSDANEKSKDDTLVIVGPEGGFTNDEIEMATGHQIDVLSLGQQILRVETAAITAVTLWQYEKGNMSL